MGRFVIGRSLRPDVPRRIAFGVEPTGDRPQRPALGAQPGHHRRQVGVRFVGPHPGDLAGPSSPPSQGPGTRRGPSVPTNYGVDRGPAQPHGAGDRGDLRARGLEPADRRLLLGRDLDRPAGPRGAAEPDPPGPCRGLAGDDPLGPDFGLVLGDRGQDVGHQPAGGGGQVEPVAQRDEVDLAAVEVLEYTLGGQ